MDGGELDAGAVREVASRLVAERPGIGADELVATVTAELGRVPASEAEADVVERVLDRFLTIGRWVMLHPDRLLDPARLAGGLVLTHRLSESERSGSMLLVSTDLAGFAHVQEPLRTSDGVELVCLSGAAGHRSWAGEEGWLDRYPAGALLAVRVGGEVVHIEALGSEPAEDPGLVAALRAVYDVEVAEPDLPVAISELVWALVVEDPTRFTTPARPLVEMFEAAGLEVEGGFAVHDPILWDNQRRLARLHDVMDVLEHRDEQLAALAAIDVLDGNTIDPTNIEAAMADLEAEIISAVASIVFDDDDGDPEAVAEVLAGLFTSRWRPATAARLRWFAAVAAERLCDSLAAVAHLEEAVRLDESFLPAVDRLAWSRADQGDAAGAARLWRRLDPGSGGVGYDLAMVERYISPDRTTLGRNDRCWCGSGRKYKACHLGRSETAPLPERVGWLCHKAAGFAERRGGQVAEDVFELARLRAGDDESNAALARALGDPLVLDVALHELGWFDHFLAERGPLLPADEVLLAQSWALVDRTLYEIVEADRGTGVTVTDLRTGNRIEVRDRRFSEQARPGWLVCGRAVPDGAGHQFIGGLFVVRPGTEAYLLDLLEDGDGFSIVEFVADADRPPPLLGDDSWDREDDEDDEDEDLENSPELKAALESIRDQFERRWCDEPVPALGGLTPRAAVADVARREEVVRLVASFPEAGDEIDLRSGRAGMRPHRLRELLGLE